MRHGSTRSDAEYLWPASLRVPTRPPKLVYLDVLHWIRLAKALAGHPDGRDCGEILDACLSARTDGRALFPIADATYVEVTKNQRHRQRRDIREAIEVLSGYMVVTARPVISELEVEAMLDRFVGVSPEPLGSVDYLDWGVARAFGRVGGFKVKTISGEDVTAATRAAFPAGPEAFDALIGSAELQLQRSVLDGPASDEEAAQLRARGWDPTSTPVISRNRLHQELEQVERFNANPRWRAGRIRDVVSGREVLIEINKMLSRGLVARGATFQSLFDSPDISRRQLDSMPSFDVAVTFKTEYHRDAKHRWTVNDIHDIDALASTMPYCDVVVTDKAAAAIANRTGLAERLGSLVVARLDDLIAHL